jgi:hypothetical protein
MRHFGVFRAVGPMLLVAAIGGTGDAGAPPSRPSALVALEANRRALASGRVEWYGAPEGRPELAMRYVSRFAANGDAIFENRGDPQGWTVYANELTHEGLLKYPQLFLARQDEVWRFQETGHIALMWKGEAQSNPWSDDIKDVRYVGVSPSTDTLGASTGFAGLWSPSSPLLAINEWEQEQHGDIFRVTGYSANGAKCVWEINAEKGWNPERISVEFNGRRLLEVVLDLEQFGDAWFPRRTDYYADGKPYYSVLVASGTFNDPNDPEQFGPADLGLEPGTNVSWVNRPQPGRVLCWDGERLLNSTDEFSDLVRAGKRQWGPTFQKIIRGEDWSSPYETDRQRAERASVIRASKAEHLFKRHESVWEAYVRAFIGRNELTDEQTTQAWQILGMCQTAAEEETRRQRLECTPLITEMLAKGEQFPKRKQEQLDKLLATVRTRTDDIFESRLKPRLDRLLTRAQRAKAATQPTSAPGTK